MLVSALKKFSIPQFFYLSSFSREFGGDQVLALLLQSSQNSLAGHGAAVLCDGAV